MLKDKMHSDMVSAMKKGERKKVDVLRFVISAVKYEEIEKKADLTDGEVIKLLQKEVKKRKDAITLFEKGGRADLVESEEYQLSVIKGYLPELISGEELEAEVKNILYGIQDKSNRGKVIGQVLGKLGGRADNTEAVALVNRLLGQGL